MSSPDDTFPHNFLSTSPAHGVAGHRFLYAGPLRSPTPILLELPVPRHSGPAVAAENELREERYANYVWNASVVLADKVAECEIDVKGRKVLELGCGLGLPSIVAARMGAQQVVLTDYDDPAGLQDTRRAVEEALASPLRERCVVVGHTWGESIAPILQALPSYELVLVADCVWDRSLHGPLIQTLRTLLESSPGAVVHFSSGFHTGRGTVAEFLARAARAGVMPLVPSEWYELSVEGEVRAWEWRRVGGFWFSSSFSTDSKRSCGSSTPPAWRLGFGDEERQEERNRWTLYGTLGLLEE
ncbi:hypothetical protein JCM3774_000515 [Rhodotorula dairenensis]